MLVWDLSGTTKQGPVLWQFEEIISNLRYFFFIKHTVKGEQCCADVHLTMSIVCIILNLNQLYLIDVVKIVSVQLYLLKC